MKVIYLERKEVKWRQVEASGGKLEANGGQMELSTEGKWRAPHSPGSFPSVPTFHRIGSCLRQNGVTMGLKRGYNGVKMGSKWGYNGVKMGS
jgi:hypothetical protein